MVGLERVQATLVEEIIQLGIQPLKLQRAMNLYRSGLGSLGYIAEDMGLSKRDLICEARAHGLVPLFDAPMVGEELGE